MVLFVLVASLYVHTQYACLSSDEKNCGMYCASMQNKPVVACIGNSMICGVCLAGTVIAGNVGVLNVALKSVIGLCGGASTVVALWGLAREGHSACCHDHEVRAIGPAEQSLSRSVVSSSLYSARIVAQSPPTASATLYAAE